MTEIAMPTETRTALEDLIVKKRAGEELGAVGRIPILDKYIAEALPQIRAFSVTLPKPEHAPFELLNLIFRKALDKFSIG